MEEVESQADFRRVEPSVFLGQSSLSLHMKHKIATTHKFDDEKKPRGRLEARMEANKEGMVAGRLEDVFLRLDPVNVLVVSDHLLLDDLHGVEPTGLFQLHHQDFGVAAPTDHPDQVKVVDRYDLACVNS